MFLSRILVVGLFGGVLYVDSIEIDLRLKLHFQSSVYVHKTYSGLYKYECRLL